MKARLMTLAIMVVLAGCRALPGPGAGGSTDEVLGDWELASGTRSGAALPILNSHRITLSLREGEVSGTAACNDYGGAAEITGTSIMFRDIAQTEMACEPPEVMDSESAYLEALLATDTIGLEGEQLILSGSVTELRFTRQVPVPEAELIDTEWVLDTLIRGEVASSTVGDRATLTLASDGTLSGSTGCRVMSGRYVIQGDEVQVTEMMMSANPCEAGIAEQDGHVVSVVGDRFTVQIDGRRLTLTSSGGHWLGLSYTAAGDG